MQLHNETPERLRRRAFLKSGTLLLSSCAVSGSLIAPKCAEAADEPGELSIGLITDLHYADKRPSGTRHYRETLDKLGEAGEHFTKHNPTFTVELGDFIDAADSVETELGYLKRINREFAGCCKQRHYVLGNHCVHTLKKEEFLDGVEQEKSYYSFDSGNFHFVVLDACFRSDGKPYGRKNFVWTDPNVPAEELEWLQSDLSSTNNKTIVFAHQRLDVSNQHGVKNAHEVRKVLEQSGRVLAAFQGHSHKNDHKDINGIHYCTLVAMVEGAGVENNGYSILTIARDGTMRVDGFRQQADYAWKTA